MDNIASMGTSQAFQHASEAAGWDIYSQVQVLLGYIEQQQDHDSFADYLEYQVTEEVEATEEED